MNAAEQRLYGFLCSFVENLNTQNFLCFVTGSFVCIGQSITVGKNLVGLACRPIAHTCLCVLELSVAYGTSFEFTQKFKVLSSEIAWIMDAV